MLDNAKVTPLDSTEFTAQNNGAKFGTGTKFCSITIELTSKNLPVPILGASTVGHVGSVREQNGLMAAAFARTQGPVPPPTAKVVLETPQQIFNVVNLCLSYQELSTAVGLQEDMKMKYCHITVSPRGR